MAENTPRESELAEKVRYSVGLIRSSAEDFPHDPRAQIQLKVCEDVELVLTELEARCEQLEKENTKLRGAITSYVDLSWLEELGDD